MTIKSKIKEIKKKSKNDSYSYKGWLNSDYFLKRCFGVLGHYLVGGLLIYAIFLLILFLFGIIIVILGGIFSLFY